MINKVKQREQIDYQHVREQNWQPISDEKQGEMVRRYPPCAGFVEAYYSQDYKVLIYDTPPRLAIYSRSNKPISSWVVLQYIKNHFWGDGTMAVEMFPPQSSVINISHTRHLWKMDSLISIAKEFAER